MTDEQLQRRRQAVRRAVRNGDIPRSQVRKSLRKAVVREARIERRQAANTIGGPANGAGASNDTASADVIQGESELTAGDDLVTPSDAQPIPDAGAKDESMVSTPMPTQLPPDVRAALRERLPDGVKQRLRQASPAERRDILRNLRKRSQSDRNRQEIRKRLRDLRKNK